MKKKYKCAFKIIIQSIVYQIVLLFFFQPWPWVSAVEARTIHVPGDYSKIQSAIDNAGDGDEIHIAAGTYIENISITGKFNLKLYGSTSGETVIEPFDRESVVLNCYGSPFLELQSLTVKGSNARTSGRGTIVLDNCSTFLIRNCSIGTQEFPALVGIRLRNTGAGSVENCRLQYGQNGIEASSDCSNINVSDCVLHDFSANAIRLDLGTQSGWVAEVKNNEVYSSHLGISVSGPVFLTGNICHDNDFNYYIDPSSAAADITNTSDGKPVYVFKNTSPSIPENAGYVALYGCSNTIISNLVLSKNHVGVLLDHCSDITLENITATSTAGSSMAAVMILNSNHISVNNSNIMNNETGLKAFSSSYVTVEDNAFTGNGLGMSFANSNYLDFIGNTVSANDGGISVYGGSVVKLQQNSFSNNTGGGLSLDDISQMTVAGNTIMGNGDFGLELHDVSGTFTSNTISNNRQNIKLQYDTNAAVIMDTSNTVAGKPIYWLRGISDATLPSDAGLVVLGGCTNIVVDGLTFKNNSDGVLLLNSSGCTLRNLTLENNDYGVRIFGDSNNTIIERSSIINNLYSGIYLDESGGNTIRENRIRNNKEWGIKINYNYSEYSNQIYQNDLAGNTRPGGGAGHLSVFLENDVYNSPAPVSYAYDNKSLTSLLGNHYGDYAGVDTNGDGIGDTNYGMAGRGKYPLMFDPTFKPQPVRGDVTGDFRVDLADAIMALKVTAGLPASSIQKEADVNGDHKIGMEESIYILQTVSQ